MSTVTFELNGDVAIVTMDDAKANALSPPKIEALTAAFDRALEEAKVVILTGREGRLCGGFDLKYLMRGPDEANELLRLGAALYMKIYEHPQPVIVACNGHAVAGGALLLGVGDFRIGADGPFKIGLNEITIGMPLPIFAYEIARARINPEHLWNATLGATLYEPKEAMEAGWLDQAVPADELASRALQEAWRLAKLSTPPFAATKQSMHRAVADHIRATLEENIIGLTAQMQFG